MTDIDPKCSVCLDFLKERGLTLTGVREMLSRPEDEPAADESVADEPVAEESARDEVASQEQRQDEVQNVAKYQDIEKYFESLQPTIKLMSIDEAQGKVHFLCTVCVSRRYPEGKVNIAGKPVLRGVKHFVERHLEAVSHQMNEARQREQAHAQQQAQQSDPGGQLPAHPGASMVEDNTCHGYQLRDECTGTLRHYREEFSIWASHVQLEGRVQHRYSLDASSGVWTIYHGSCSGQAETRSPIRMCRSCEALGAPRGLARMVVRFVAKYHLAILLSRRLFGTPDDVAEYLEKVKHSTFGVNNSKYWKSLQEMDLVVMQTYVKSSFVHYNASHISPNLRVFITEVVMPSVKVNVTSMSDGLAGLTAHFVTLLSTQRLNASWISLAHPGISRM